jgi:cytochrome c556
MVPGRHVARPGEKSETPGVELEPSEMEALINKDLASWRKRAHGLHEAGAAAIQAIDAKDADKLFEVGEQIERACESCHSQYWYPKEKIPPVPTSGAQ